MINKFLDYISVEKRYSQNTLVSYKKDLEDLLLFISETEGTEDLKKVDKKIIRNFIVSLSALSANTIAISLSTVLSVTSE